MKKIIYSSNFTTHQKIILTFIFLITFFLGNMMFIGLLAWLLGAPEFQDYTVTSFFLVLLLPISILILGMLFCKKGIMIKNKKLYKVQFLFRKVLKKKQLDLDNITDISILSFNGTQKFAWVSSASPDQGYQVKRYELYVLNDKHTVKKFLISTQKKELADTSMATISQELKLNSAVYNPKF